MDKFIDTYIVRIAGIALPVLAVLGAIAGWDIGGLGGSIFGAVCFVMFGVLFGGLLIAYWEQVLAFGAIGLFLLVVMLLWDLGK